MTQNHRPRSVRSAYSLVEMLIVVTIMIMLVAVTLPVAKKVMDGSQGREASRQLSAYIQMAKSRALQTGRPCGLAFVFQQPPGFQDYSTWITTGATGNVGKYWPVRQVTQLYLAEVQAPYCGGTTTARGRIMPSSITTGAYDFNPVYKKVDPMTQAVTYPTDASEVTILNSLIGKNEPFYVRFDYKGAWFLCQRQGSTSQYKYLDQVKGNPAQVLVPPAMSQAVETHPGFPYQVLRMPKAVGNPLTLPNGTCIDAVYSGAGNSAHQFPLPTGLTAPASTLTVLLSPEGGVDSMYVSGIPTSDPIGSLFFLVGKAEKVSDPYDQSNTSGFPNVFNQSAYTDVNNSNLADPTSLWVVVNRSTGQVTTAQNMPNQAIATANPNRLDLYLQAARQAAIYGEQMGGR